MFTDRQYALAWWDTLRNTSLMNGITKDKGYYTDLLFGFNMRMYRWLSEEEIEKVWKNAKQKGLI